MKWYLIAPLILAALVTSNELHLLRHSSEDSRLSEANVSTVREVVGVDAIVRRHLPLDAGLRGWPQSVPAPSPVPEPTYAPEPSPPPAPTAAPYVAPEPRVVDGDMMAHAEMVCQAFPEARQMCEHVVWAESLWGDWRCHVYGPCWSPTNDCGLLQTNIIHAGRYAAHGWNIYVDCFVPERNLVIAREIFNSQGIGAWTTAR